MLTDPPPRSDLTITVCPMPKGATPLHPDPNHPCRCSVMEGRCQVHGAMMREIRAAWEAASDRTANVIRSLADGFGAPGAMIEMNSWDWSGVRDSTERSVEDMWKALHG